MPLAVWKDDTELQQWINPPGWPEEDQTAGSNPNAASLMMGIDLDPEIWGWAPEKWTNNLGNVLITRSDGQDVVLEDVKMMCYCVRWKLRPLIEDAMGFGLVWQIRQQVLDYITWENMEKCRDEMGKAT